MEKRGIEGKRRKMRGKQGDIRERRGKEEKRGENPQAYRGWKVSRLST